MLALVGCPKSPAPPGSGAGTGAPASGGSASGTGTGAGRPRAARVPPEKPPPGRRAAVRVLASADRIRRSRLSRRPGTSRRRRLSGTSSSTSTRPSSGSPMPTPSDATRSGSRPIRPPCCSSRGTPTSAAPTSTTSPSASDGRRLPGYARRRRGADHSGELRQGAPSVRRGRGDLLGQESSHALPREAISMIQIAERIGTYRALPSRG
jgi:hypothetical protein